MIGMGGLGREIFFRNRGTISDSEQRKLAEATVGLVGLGGTGGFALESLARCGIGSFVLFDFDRVELSNFNRQLLAEMGTVDEEKAKLAGERIKKINPNASVVAHIEKFSSVDSGKIQVCDIVIDCSDNVETHLVVAEACGKLKIPFVFCSASGSGGMCSVVLHPADFRGLMQISKIKRGKSSHKSVLSQYNKCTSIIAPAAALSGTIAASQAINFILGKQHIRAPEFIFFDLFKKEILWKKRL